LEEGWGRWVVADVMTADMTSLFDAHHAALADWEYAPLTVALLEAAGRGVCWMKQALVVMPTLSSSRLLGITSCLLRQAIKCSIHAAALPSVFTSASRSCMACVLSHSLTSRACLRVAGQVTMEQRRALGAFFARPVAPRSGRSIARYPQLCSADMSCRQSSPLLVTGTCHARVWEVVAGGCAEPRVQVSGSEREWRA
jgi:hypothetical protein